jgi:hypothetical protein
MSAGFEGSSENAIRAIAESSRPRKWKTGTLSGFPRVEFRGQGSSQLDFPYAPCGPARPKGHMTICLTGRQTRERKDPPRLP